MSRAARRLDEGEYYHAKNSYHRGNGLAVSRLCRRDIRNSRPQLIWHGGFVFKPEVPWDDLPSSQCGISRHPARVPGQPEVAIVNGVSPSLGGDRAAVAYAATVARRHCGGEGSPESAYISMILEKTQEGSPYRCRQTRTDEIKRITARTGSNTLFGTIPSNRAPTKLPTIDPAAIIRTNARFRPNTPKLASRL